MRISVIVPSKGCRYLKYLLWSLSHQTVKPYEIILVIKECDIKTVEDLCGENGLPCVIIEQKKGYFTHALNIGKREAHGDVIVFTDSDVILPKRWLERWVKYHKLYRTVVGISSRDVHLDLNRSRILPTPDDLPSTRLYRWLIRTWREKPHPLLRKYRFGVYITEDYNVTHGAYIPHRQCFSLPFRGVNMSFKSEYIHDIWFPEYPLLKRAPGNEQYFGLQLILKGYDTIYTPNNPVLHIIRESLSRTRDGAELKNEIEVMRSLIRGLLEKAQ